MAYNPGKTLISSALAAVPAQSLIALGSKTITQTVAGALPGVHAVFAGPLTDPGSLIICQAWVSAPNTVTLRITNLSATAVNTAPTSWMLALVASS